jgi:hypothetical protein
MKTRITAVAAPFARRAAATTAPPVSDRPSCQPPPLPTQTVAEDQHSQVTPTPHRRVRWIIVVAGVLVLLASTLAAKRITFYHAPPVASYNTCLAELDTKLSRALADQLRAAGFEFDAAIVSVEGPACQRAVSLVNGLRREDEKGLSGVTARIAVRHAGNGTWSFAGARGLAALRFDVDAAAEMRRLAQSTPPEFPPVALVAPTLNQAKADAASPFVREYAVRLYAPAGGGRGDWLDLETGRCLTGADLDYYYENPRGYVDWCRTNGVDLSAAMYPDRSYWLFTRYLASAPVDGRLWEQATPEDIISHPALRSSRPLPQFFISPADDQTHTYLFRTQQGSFGILRVLEFNPVSRQLRIQYKLARQEAKAET